MDIFSGLLQWVVNAITSTMSMLTGPLAPLMNMLGSTTLAYTTQNAVVVDGWRTMVLVADMFLGLFLTIGVVQIMYGDTLGSLRRPAGRRYVPRSVLPSTAIDVIVCHGTCPFSLLLGLAGRKQ